MDNQLLADLNLKQAQMKNAANMTEEQFVGAYTHLTDTMKANQKAKRDLVDQKIFGGDAEKNAQEKNQDFSHDYVLESMKKRVQAANEKVFSNIQTYGKAEVTEQDKSVLGKLKGLKNFAVATFEKARATSLMDKIRAKSQDKAELFADLAREKNEFSDYSTGTMLSRLLKYTEFHSEYLKATRENRIINDNKHFEELIRDRVEGIYGEPGDALKKRLYTYYRFSVVPFLQTYKKGWFGRYYDLDGKRIKVKKGEKNPADYNKELLSSLMLETEKGKTKAKGKKNAATVLKENRTKKAAALTKITSDLLAQSEKFDVSRMNERYVMEHIVELQAYRDRLFAFAGLYQENRWFFYGKDFTEQQIKQLTHKDGQDPQFLNLIEKRILNMAAPIANFLESHMLAHGVRNNAVIKDRKNGFRTHITVNEKNRMNLCGETAANETGLKLIHVRNAGMDFKEATERMAQFGNDFDVVDMRAMSEEEKTEYRQQVNAEKGFVNSKACVSFLAHDIDELDMKANRPLSKDVSTAIDKELKDIQKQHKEAIEEDNVGKPFAKQMEYFPGAHMSDGVARVSDAYIQITTIKERMNSENGRDMYMTYGPELDHLYAKLYEAARMEGQLVERKMAINRKFKFGTIRNNEKELKTNHNLHELTKKSIQEQNERLRAANKAVFTAKKSSNPYAGFVQDIMAEKRLARAEQEYDEIEKKLAFVQYNLKLCYKTMLYFLGDPLQKQSTVDSFKEMRTYLNKEHLGYMMEIDRAENSDALLNEALAETEKDWQREAGNEPGAARPVIRVRRDRKENAARIYNIRRKGRENQQTEDGLRKFREKTANIGEVQAFANLCAMDPAQFVNLKTAHFFAMATEEQRDRANTLILQTGYVSLGASDVNSYYNPKVYTNPERMTRLMNNIREKGYVVKPTLREFMADIKAKVDMIKEASVYVNAQLAEQKEKKFVYIDNERIDELDSKSLENLLRHLKEKEVKLKETADQNPLKVNRIGLPLDDGEQPWLARKANRELENCRSLVSYVESRISKVKTLANYDSFGEQAYQGKYRRNIIDARLEEVRKNEFVQAEEVYLNIKDMLNEESTKTILEPLDKKIRDRIREDHNVINNDKVMSDEVMKIVTEIRSIPINSEMVKEVKDNFGFGNHPSMEVYKKYLSYVRAVNIGRDIVEMPDQYKDEVSKKLTEQMKKVPGLYEEFETRYKILSPIFSIINGYTKSVGFLGVGSPYAQRGWSGDEVEAREDQEAFLDQILDQVVRDKSASEEAVRTLEKNVKSADHLGGKNFVPIVWDRLYKSGLKLSINRAEDWKKELEKLAKETKKNKAGDERWIMMAARRMLEDWPYSFENFVGYRVEKDTAEAIRTTLHRFAGKFGSAYVDEEHAAEIAGFISKVNSAGYVALTQDKRKRLDKALETAGYNAHEFKKIFEEVKIDGAGLPLTFQDDGNRVQNNVIANEFIERYKDGKDEKTSKSLFEWNKRVIDLMRRAVLFEITPEMTTPLYIKKNFKTLYEKCKSFKTLQEFYNKDFKDHPEIFENHKVSPKLQIVIANAFGVERNNLYKHFFEAIEAYASMNFVDAEGRFDMGLTNEEINSDKITPDQMRVKIAKIQDERTRKFEKISGDVRKDFDQRVIAQKIAKADEINQTLDIVSVKSDDNLFKMVQIREFEGKIHDVNLMIQNDKLAELVSSYNENREAAEAAEREIQELEKQVVILEHDKKDASEEKRKIADLAQKKAVHTMAFSEAEFSIKEFRMGNEMTYNSYKKCHDESGRFTPGTLDAPTGGYYVSFQLDMAPDMERIYKDFESMVKNDITNDMFTDYRIAERMKSKEWPKIMRDLKRLDLYLHLFEQDIKYVGVLKKGGEKNLVEDSFNNQITVRNASLSKVKKDQANVEKQIAQLSKKEKTPEIQTRLTELETSAEYLNGSKTREEDILNKITKAFDFVKVLKQDIQKKDKNTSTVAAVHKYVKMMYATMVRYGIQPDGKLMDQVIGDAAGEQLNKNEINQIAQEQEARGAEMLNQLQGKKSKEKEAEEFNRTHAKEIEKEKKERQKAEEKKKKEEEKKKKGGKLKSDKEINIALDAFDHAQVIDLKDSIKSNN